MSAFAALRAVIQKITRGLCYLGLALLLPMMLLTSAEVVGRGVWSRPIPGTLELSSYMLAIFILLGLAYTQQVKGHVQVTMLTSRLPVRLAAALEIITTSLCLFMSVILCWQGYAVGIEEKAVSDMLRIPQLPFRLLVAVAGGLLTLEFIFDLVDSAKRLAQGGEA